MNKKLMVLVCFGVLINYAQAELPVALEADYAEAVLAYNAKNYNQALKLIGRLYDKAPEIPEILELQALSYKATQDTVNTTKTYEQLIQAKIKLNKPESEIAPYHFELGLIRYKENKTSEAKKHFEYALKNDFNSGVTQLYLGLIAFNSGKWGEAEEYFQGVISHSAEDLIPVAYFYRGQCHAKLEYPQGATHSFTAARDAAANVIEDKDANVDAKKTAQKIFDATDKVLKPFDKGQFFGSLGLMTAYDSNVTAMPSTVTGESADASRKAAIKENFMAGFGYLSSPMRKFQFVPSMRVSLNYLYNKLLRNYEYNDFVASFYVTRNPIAKFSYGLKLEGTMSVQNETKVQDTSSFKFAVYSFNASTGPYFKYELARKMNIGAEAFIQPQKFSGDDTASADIKRSGIDYWLRFYFQNDSGRMLFNPNVTVRADYNNSSGKENRSQNANLELSNIMHFLGRINVTETFSIGRSNYNSRASGVRTDTPMTFRLTGTFRIAKSWMALLSGDYTSNDSNIIASYKYTKYTVNGGFTFTF